jgi:hypothetical protein
LPFYNSKNVTKNVMPINNYINATITNFGTVDPLSLEVEVGGNNELFLMIPLYNGAGLEVSEFSYDGNFDGLNIEINGVKSIHSIRAFGTKDGLVIHSIGYLADFNDDEEKVEVAKDTLHIKYLKYEFLAGRWLIVESKVTPISNSHIYESSFDGKVIYTNLGTVDPLTTVELPDESEISLVDLVFRNLFDTENNRVTQFKFLSDLEFPTDETINFFISGVTNYRHISCYQKGYDIVIDSLKMDDKGVMHSLKFEYKGSGIGYREQTMERVVKKEHSNLSARTIIDDTVLGKVKCLSFGDNDLDGVKCTIIDENSEYQQTELLEVLMLNVVALFYEDDTYAMPFGYEGNFDGVHLLIEGLPNTSKVELIGNDKQLLIKAIGYMCNPDFDPNADIEDWDDFKDKNFIDLDNYVAITTYLMSDGNPPIEGYGVTFSIIPELIFRMPLSGGGGSGGYGDAGTGAYTEKTHDVDLFGQTLSVKYRYSGTDPATVTVKDSDNAVVDFWYVVIVNALMRMSGAGYTFSKDLCTLDFQIIEVKVDGQYNFGDDEIRIVGQSRPFYNAGVLVEQFYYFSDEGFAFIDIILKNDGTVEVRYERPFVPFGGGGGGSLQEQQLYIYDYDWQDMGGTYEATKNISGIDYDSMIWYSAETSSLEDFADAGIFMIRQGYGEVTFSCKEVPQNQISVIVRWQ